MLGSNDVGLLNAADAVESARKVADRWEGLGFTGRRHALLAWKRRIAAGMADLADTITAETGKPAVDAQVEIALTLTHLDWAARHARRELGPRRVGAGLLAFNERAYLEYQPVGVVGVIGPWNYPVFTPMGSIAYALAAGNAVVAKFSEYTPRTGRWLADAFAAAVPGCPGVFTVIDGGADVGGQLCRAGVDKMAFTGSGATGRVVMAACAESLTPLVAECGGKDAAIVAADADLRAAADAVVWSAMANGGQACSGIERAYVVRPVKVKFIEEVRSAALRVRSGPDGQYGPIVVAKQLEVIDDHIRSALADGGWAVVGGPDSVRPPFVDPVVVADVPETSSSVRVETFGPTLIINEVATVDEAIDKVNQSEYGLGGAIFTKSKRKGYQWARQLRTGMAAVNGVTSYAAVPALPFGGRGESGFGRIHGSDGLRQFSRPKAITVRRFAAPLNLTSFSTPVDKALAALSVMARLHSRW